MKIQWLYVIVGVTLTSTWNHSNHAGNGKVELGADVGFAVRERLRLSCHSVGKGGTRWQGSEELQNQGDLHLDLSTLGQFHL